MLSEKELSALLGTITDKERLLWKGVLYGEFGTRKTTTALRCRKNKAVLLHADRGWQVYKNHPDEFPDDEIIPVEYQGLSQIRAIVEAIVCEQGPFAGTDLFVWDTIGQTQENYIDFLLENTQYTGKFREKPVTKQGAKMDGEVPEAPGLPDYHISRNKIRPVIDLLVKAPFNVMFLSHVREPSFIEVDKGNLEKRANLTEALYKVLARDATFIGLTRKEKGRYTVDFEPKTTQSAKSQIPELTDKKIDLDDLPEILKNWSNQ